MMYRGRQAFHLLRQTYASRRQKRISRHSTTVSIKKWLLSAPSGYRDVSKVRIVRNLGAWFDNQLT